MQTPPTTPSPNPPTFDSIVSSLVRALRAAPDTARFVPRRSTDDGPSPRAARAPSTREIYGCAPCTWGTESDEAPPSSPACTEAWSVSPTWRPSAVLSRGSLSEDS